MQWFLDFLSKILLIAEWNKLPINNGSSFLGQLGRQHLVSCLHRLPRLAIVVEGELVGALGESLESGVTHLVWGGQHQGAEEEQTQRGDQDLCRMSQGACQSQSTSQLTIYLHFVGTK